MPLPTDFLARDVSRAAIGEREGHFLLFVHIACTGR